MDDLEVALKMVGLLTVNFVFSLITSNCLSSEIDLIKSPVTSLKIFCTVHAMGYILTLVISRSFVTPQAHQTKEMFIVSSAVKWLLGIIIFHCLAVLYGASLVRSVEHTFIWSVMMSDLVVLPCLVVGWDEIIKTAVSDNRKSITLPSCLCSIMLLTLLGAWFGAFTLPLDWDRDWQAWPIPCAAGAMIGHFVSLLTSGSILFWKNMNKEKNKFV